MPTSPVANGLAVAQQMASAVAGIEFRKKETPIKHRASFHGRGSFANIRIKIYMHKLLDMMRCG